MTERAKIKDVMRKAAPLTEQLDRRFDLQLDFEDIDHIVDVYHLYNEKRQMLVRREGMSESLSNNDYIRAFYIAETAGMLLREIAPKRMRKRTRKETR